MKDFIFVLEGLDCPHCSALIEQEAGRLPQCESASLNLITRELRLEFSENQNEEQLLQKLTELVHSHEPKVQVRRKENQPAVEEHNESRKELFLLIVSAVALAAAVVTELCGSPGFIYIPLFLASYALCGAEVLFAAARNIVHGKVFDENLLMSIASLGAIAIGSYAEAAAVMLFYQIGEYFQELAVDRSRRSVSELIDNRPDTATMLREGRETVVAAREVQPGEQIIIKPGEKIPLDAVVLHGSSAVDTKSITGEPLPQDVAEGSTVFAGCINLQGVITANVIKPYDESVIADICRMIESSAANKAPVENFITRFARIYTPIVTAAAALLFLIPTLLGGVATDWLYRALVFLVVSCPCALVVSVPLGFFAGIGGAGRRGILIKGGNYLAALARCRMIALDKTGTLTKGSFKAGEIYAAPGFEPEELLRLAAAAEAHSNHPIARSIVAACDTMPQAASELRELPGLGLSAVTESKSILIGNMRLMQTENILLPPETDRQNAVHIAIDGAYAGSITISDELREDAPSAVAALRKLGIKPVMLTGDSRENAAIYAAAAGIEDFRAGLFPADKVENLKSLRGELSRDDTLAFVGDGINDAPALKLANIGIAMGGIGSDAAIEAADIVIMSDEPHKLTEAIAIAKHTTGIVKQNIVLALAVKLLILLLAAIGLVGMWAAVFADVGVALLAILNSTRAAGGRRI